MQVPRHQLCHRIHSSIRHTHHPTHIANGRTGRQGAEGDDLCHMVRAVFAGHIVDHLLPPFVAKVNIKVRHRHPLRVQKPLKQQVVLHGVNICNADTIGGNGPGAGATSRSHRYALILGVLHKIYHDQVIVRVTHLLYGVQLILQPLYIGLGRVLAVAAHHTLPAQLLEVSVVVHTAGGLIIRQLGVTKFKIKVAAPGDLLRILQRLGHGSKGLCHLLFTFKVELIRVELQPGVLPQHMVGGNADQHLLNFGILPAHIVHIVGGYQGNTGFPAQAQQSGVYRLLFRNTVILQFQIVMFRTKQIAVPQGGLLCLVIIPLQQCLGNFPGQAGRQANQALMVLLQQIAVNARLKIKALRIALRHHGDQVFVTLFVLAQQDQVIVSLILYPLPIVPGAGRHIHFAADNGAYPLPLARLIKINSPIHITVIRNRKGLHSKRLCTAHQIVQTASAVQQTKLRMHMQMRKHH